jgi:beta-glucanase (GH16 family)
MTAAFTLPACSNNGGGHGQGSDAALAVGTGATPGLGGSVGSGGDVGSGGNLGSGGRAGGDASSSAGGSVGGDARANTGGSTSRDAAANAGGSTSRDAAASTGGASTDARAGTGGTARADASLNTGGNSGLDANLGTGGRTGADASSGTGGADAAGSAEAGTPPTFSADFVAADQARFYSRASNGGSASFGAANPSATDNAVAELVFKGNATLGPGDKLTPDYATEIGSNQAFGYGTFRTRVQLARCGSSEELVNGIFTYFNDGKDHDGDGLVDNSEIDIEILCSDPSIISLTIWSEYTSDTAKQGVSRVIHTKTGAYEDSLNDTASLGSGTLPAFKLAGFPDPSAFYEMGFEWHATSLRYFLVVGGNELTLWTYTDAKYIPSLPAAFLFNVWHSNDWWSSQGTADYPASDGIMRVDWFRYWKE